MAIINITDPINDLLARSAIHTSWLPLVKSALSTLPQTYLIELMANQTWLPGPQKILNAFSQPLSTTQFILFGESPYPREISANGYAFWDNAVKNLWSSNGMSKEVNRATSLRNIMKMLLVASDHLTLSDTSQEAIAELDKSKMIKTGHELFTNMITRGFLLLNASLVFRPKQVKYDAKIWLPFVDTLLQILQQKKPQIQLILFGKIAETIASLSSASSFTTLIAEHPYNVSFISNQAVIHFFRPLDLLN